MADDSATAVELVPGSYEARTSSRRLGRDAGVEVRVRAVRRRHWPAKERLRIVRETLEAGAVAKVVADRHGISTGLLYTWRKQMLATAMAGFMPVQVVAEMRSAEAPSPPAEPVAAAAPGAIEITLPSGAGIRVSGDVDVAVLRLVLAELGGR